MSTWAWKTGEQCYGYCEWYDNYYDLLFGSSATLMNFNFFLFSASVFVQIIASGTPILGQNDYILTCDLFVTGAENLNPSITYQWIKNNGTQTIQMGTDRILSFSSFRFSDAGRYTCEVTAPFLNDYGDISIVDIHDVIIQSKFECMSCTWIIMQWMIIRL